MEKKVVSKELTNKVKVENKRHLANFHIAGFGYWDAAEAFEQLKVGTLLELRREPDNRFDAYAVAIYFGEYKLGFIPRTDNREISKYLEMGYGDIYETRIIRLSPQEHPEQQVEVTVKIKRRE